MKHLREKIENKKVYKVYNSCSCVVAEKISKYEKKIVIILKSFCQATNNFANHLYASFKLYI